MENLSVKKQPNAHILFLFHPPPTPYFLFQNISFDIFIVPKPDPEANSHFSKLTFREPVIITSPVQKHPFS